MDEITNWIDKKIIDLVDTEKYQEYFRDQLPTIFEDRRYIANNAKGIELVLSDLDLVVSIHLFGNNRISESEFYGILPLNMNFSFSKDIVRSILGTPQRSGGGYSQILYGVLPVWDKYIMNKFSIHLEYSSDESSISMITIASLSLESYLNADLQ